VQSLLLVFIPDFFYFFSSSRPAMPCAFGGTRGNHDTGTYLDTIQCYDRVRNEIISSSGIICIIVHYNTN